MTKTERELREAQYALNRATPQELDDATAETRTKILEIRDQVWDLGVSLFGWED